MFLRDRVSCSKAIAVAIAVVSCFCCFEGAATAQIGGESWKRPHSAHQGGRGPVPGDNITPSPAGGPPNLLPSP